MEMELGNTLHWIQCINQWGHCTGSVIATTAQCYACLQHRRSPCPCEDRLPWWIRRRFQVSLSTIAMATWIVLLNWGSTPEPRIIPRWAGLGPSKRTGKVDYSFCPSTGPNLDLDHQLHAQPAYGLNLRSHMCCLSRRADQRIAVC